MKNSWNIKSVGVIALMAPPDHVEVVVVVMIT